MTVVKLIMEMRKHAFDSWTCTQKRERQTNFGHMVMKGDEALWKKMTLTVLILPTNLSPGELFNKLQWVIIKSIQGALFLCLLCCLMILISLEIITITNAVEKNDAQVVMKELSFNCKEVGVVPMIMMILQ